MSAGCQYPAPLSNAGYNVGLQRCPEVLEKPERRAVILRAVRDAVPMFVPAIPFAFVLGVVIVESGLGALLGWSSSPIMFGGAAQITLLSLLGEGASITAAVSAALIVGARHLLYSAALAPRFRDQPRWFRALAPYLLVDQVFALSMLRQDDSPEVFRCYYLSVGLVFWALWLLFSALGLVLGPQIPAAWKLAFSAPVLFAGLMVLAIERWQQVVAALVGAAVALLLASLPNRSGMLLGAIAGIAAGLLADALTGPRR
jgi:predicted branched-subunit amino acid permease